MERTLEPSRNWSSYYARTANLPTPVATESFLREIPKEGRILDFGAGSGRWSAAFLRDRPDIVIDALDQNIDAAALLPETWHGKKIQSSFQDFSPSKTYDGIWAQATLFFMNERELSVCFHKLATALKEGGTISFSMVDDCHTAKVAKFHGMSKDKIEAMLDREGLKLSSLTLDEKAAYGSEKIIIPTYDVVAQKMK